MKKFIIETILKYKKPENFKKFEILDGNLIWGKHWDMIFPIQQLYSGIIP
ncbi:MAG TPA: hypothetical protein VJT83_04835 [Chitinophagaceae bacterium]|nr:hypothetical protein [Chitinophagaceae bacterium]